MQYTVKIPSHILYSVNIVVDCRVRHANHFQSSEQSEAIDMVIFLLQSKPLFFLYMSLPHTRQSTLYILFNSRSWTAMIFND